MNNYEFKPDYFQNVKSINLASRQSVPLARREQRANPDQDVCGM